jgi:hypothetical protein
MRHASFERAIKKARLRRSYEYPAKFRLTNKSSRLAYLGGRMLRSKRPDNVPMLFPELVRMRARAQQREMLTMVTMFTLGLMLLAVVASLASCIIWLVGSGAGWLLRLLRDSGLSILDTFRTAVSFLF